MKHLPDTVLRARSRWIQRTVCRPSGTLIQLTPPSRAATRCCYRIRRCPPATGQRKQERGRGQFGGQPYRDLVEDKAWIGSNAVVLPVVRIGYGSVIGAGSVVSRSIPSLTDAARICRSAGRGCIWRR
ncbi:hypothetical protein ABZX30_36835 [Streptomyces sp. NPDC004542]|uniref:hypothetical protein n=1 Tax=Streptomyces sp. NPDC004542 TaxID=3154281 RepID=UPI0033B2723C